MAMMKRICFLMDDNRFIYWRRNIVIKWRRWSCRIGLRMIMMIGVLYVVRFRWWRWRMIVLARMMVVLGGVLILF